MDLVYTLHKPIQQYSPPYLIYYIMRMILLILNKSHTTQQQVKTIPDNSSVKKYEAFDYYLLGIYMTVNNDFKTPHILE